MLALLLEYGLLILYAMPNVEVFSLYQAKHIENIFV